MSHTPPPRCFMNNPNQRSMLFTQPADACALTSICSQKHGAGLSNPQFLPRLPPTRHMHLEQFLLQTLLDLLPGRSHLSPLCV
eukprot:5199129-Amphidinium_carterae.1